MWSCASISCNNASTADLRKFLSRRQDNPSVTFIAERGTSKADRLLRAAGLFSSQSGWLCDCGDNRGEHKQRSWALQFALRILFGHRSLCRFSYQFDYVQATKCPYQLRWILNFAIWMNLNINSAPVFVDCALLRVSLFLPNCIMDVFEVHNRIVGDYANYVRSFISIGEHTVPGQGKQCLMDGNLPAQPLLPPDRSFATRDTRFVRVSCSLDKMGRRLMPLSWTF